MSPYFDGCYFSPAYFDAAPCAATSGRNIGRLVRRRRLEWDELEDLWLLDLSDEYLKQ